MKKICFISGDISRSGGTERVGTIIANELSKREYSVSILSFWKCAGSYFHVDPNIKVDGLLCAKEGKLYRTYIYPVIKLHNYIQTNDIDIIIDIDTVLSVYSCMAVIGTKCKVISWEHFNYWAMVEKNKKKRFIAKKIIKRWASKLVVLTDQDRVKHIDTYNMADEFVRTIHNPCLMNVIPSYNFNNNTFLAVGRLTRQKGFDLLLKAWSQFQKVNDTWKLVILGSGELKEELVTLSKKLDLKKVHFVEHTANVEQYYREASCYLLPSRYEGFPMVLLEAQSYGLPCIAFDCKTGPADLIKDNENGFLVENANINKFAECMQKFTKDRSAAEAMSAASLENMKRYRLSSIIDEWEDIIKSV